MSFLFYVAATISNLFTINDAGDALEINDEGDTLLY